MTFTLNFIFVYALTLYRFLKMKFRLIYCFAVNEYIYQKGSYVHRLRLYL